MRIVAVNAAEKSHLFLQLWAANGHHTSAIALDVLAELDGTVEADVILLDLQGVAADNADRLARHLNGRTVIDCSNPSNVAELRCGAASIAEQVARACPGAAVVKALNVITPAALRHVLKQAGAEGVRGYTSGYYCGDDDAARRTAAALIDEANLDAMDCGPLTNATLLEALGLLAHHLEEQATLGEYFTISIVRKHGDNSPLDHWM